MELGLKWKEFSCCEAAGHVAVSHEETMETAIPEYCPDVARIVDTVGQLKVREKKLSNGRLTITGAVSVTVLYTSEESAGLRSLTLTVPYTCMVDDQRLASCRSVCVCGRLPLVEARSVTARKLYIRVMMEFETEGIACPQKSICQDTQEEPALHLRRREQEVQVLTDVWERECNFNQECTPTSQQGIPEDLLLDRICLRIISCQRMGTKLIIKGEAYVSFLYRTDGQGLCTYDAVLPFSFVLDGGELPEDGIYQAQAWPIDSDVRILRTDEGCSFGVSMRIGILIKVYQQLHLSYIEDLYSTCQDAQVARRPVSFAQNHPARHIQSEASQTLEFGQGQQPFVCLTGLECGAVSPTVEGNQSVLRTNVRLKVLYLDETGSPVSTERVLEVSVPTEDLPKTVRAMCAPAAVQLSGGSCQIKVPVDFFLEQEEPCRIDTVESVELQECGKEETPSLVLRRTREGEELWDIAKQYRTDPELIRSANQLGEGETLPGGILLIPKVR